MNPATLDLLTASPWTLVLLGAGYVAAYVALLRA